MSEVSKATESACGIVEADASCRACGHSLRHLARYEHETLKLVVVRCPECGQVWPASERSVPSGLIPQGSSITSGRLFFVSMCGALAAMLLAFGAMYLLFGS